MASQKHLKDLLEEDQEPFQLQSYISDRRRQIMHLQVKKRRPVSQNAGLPSRFCRNACLFSLRESPDPTKSPLFEPKSPNRSQNAIFVNIPVRTASMLLEAAVRIQKESSEGSKTKTRNVGNAFGIFGSMLKKLTHRRKREISRGKDGGGVSSVKDMLRWESPVVRKIVTKRKGEEQSSSQTQKSASETQFSRGSSSSGVWSESVINGERSWDCDFEPSISSSCGSDGSDELACGLTNGSDFSEDKRFCESPFHFVLQTTMLSPGGFRTPNFTSPAASPRRDCPELKKESYEVEKLKKLEMEEEEEEDKEQSSPVSVLDPPFEDDDEDIHMDDNNSTSSFRSVQKAKNLLLQKLCRFEQLAGLDLEKTMSDEETEEDMEEEEMRNHYQCEMITQRVLKTYFEDMTEVPEGIEALISDLVTEELLNHRLLQDGEDQVAKRVCERLRSWRDVESNTIDMMVEHDFRTESLGSWRSKNDAEAVVEIEFEIFEDLVEELSQDIGGYW
ncbi:Histone-lysine N-methyltransferase SETD1B-like protein [Hirschfeldia incana]|nr:Histone-lysine N-methyltransferase SETD1B-like protein [Hirschfeldia incana]